MTNGGPRRQLKHDSLCIGADLTRTGDDLVGAPEAVAFVHHNAAARHHRPGGGAASGEFHIRFTIRWFRAIRQELGA
jgi:hypothetical protein